MALAGNGGQGLDQQCGEGTGHTTHLLEPKGEESTGETQNRNCEQGEPLGAGLG